MKQNVGSNPPKREAYEKVTGAAKYIDDLPNKGVLHGATVRSTVACGKIKKIKFGKDIPWDEFTIVSAKDIPKSKKTNRNVVKLIVDDQPFLANQRVEHKHEAILLLAHRDRETLLRGLQGIEITYKQEKPVLDYRKSKVSFKKYRIKKGSPKAELKKATQVFTGTYETPHQEQLYIENQGVIAEWKKDGTLHVRGSLQCPFYVQKAMRHLFNLPEDKVRIEQTTTGGGFGGKEEYPSMISGHAALLAKKADKPVKLIYDRHEDIQATTKRHPSQTNIKAAVDENNKLLAVDIEFIIDAGAYATLSSVVLSRGTIHAAGPYACPHVSVRADARMTNTVPNGAFRGFGAPQSCFAMEMHMTHMAKELGIDPLEFRRMNALQVGDTTATSQELEESVSMVEVIDATREMSRYDLLKKKIAAENRKKSPVKYGLGVCTFFHGAGFTGSGEKMLGSQVEVALTKEGAPEVRCGSTEIGQGTITVFAQFAADALGISPNAIEVAVPDTIDCPDSGPTVASRTSMVVGGLVFQAALDLKKKLEKASGEMWKSDDDFRRIAKAQLKKAKKKSKLTGSAKYEQPPSIHWDEERYYGSAYACYGWACVIVLLAVDTRTLETRIFDCWTTQDIGKAIHPTLCAGQVEGGTLQALGWGLLEEPVVVDGDFRNANMTNYIVPTSLDTPDIHVKLWENPTKYSPLGAKGVGEMPMDGPAAAVAAAIDDAIGIWPWTIPATPHTLLKLGREQGVLDK
jgi:CO/xanthine dehydrogenase Mo-binding subunit